MTTISQSKNTSGTFTLRTPQQAAIFVNELVGQFSDGHWENLRGDHWQVWCHADVTVGEKVGRTFPASKDNWNVAAKELLEAVGERMKGYARIAMVLGLEASVKYGDLLSWDTGKIKRPTHAGEYYDSKRALFDELNAVPGTVDAINNAVYEEKHLRADLREIKKAMKTRV